MSPANQTAKTYAALNRAFDFFNGRLFGGELPPCLVTLQRKNKAYDYARAFVDLAAQPDFSALYVELWDDADARKKRKAKSASKTRYTCPSCELHAWAKPGARLVCDEPMAAEDGDDD